MAKRLVKSQGQIARRPLTTARAQPFNVPGVADRLHTLEESPTSTPSEHATGPQSLNSYLLSVVPDIERNLSDKGYTSKPIGRHVVDMHKQSIPEVLEDVMLESGRDPWEREPVLCTSCVQR